MEGAGLRAGNQGGGGTLRGVVGPPQHEGGLGGRLLARKVRDWGHYT